MSVDHYAVPFSAIEPGEIDQEQHDGVRDVFFVSHATMLVRADLFRELDGFDVDTSPGSDDIDLCWRARLAGAPRARRAGEPGTAPARRPRSRSAARAGSRRRRRGPRRALACACWSSRTRRSRSLWVLPSGFVLTLGEAVGARADPAVAARGRGRSRVGYRGAAAGDLRQARAATQADPPGRRRRRPRPDDAGQRAIPQLARAATARRRPTRRRVQPGAGADDSGPGSSCGARRRSLALLVGLLLLVGSRALRLRSGSPTIGGFQPWPGVGSLWSTFTSPWRYTMVGARDAGHPVFAMMAGARRRCCSGTARFARTIVVVGRDAARRLGRVPARAHAHGVAVAGGRGGGRVRRQSRWRATPSARGDLGPLVCLRARSVRAARARSA